jgi:hypothetical protein
MSLADDNMMRIDTLEEDNEKHKSMIEHLLLKIEKLEKPPMMVVSIPSMSSGPGFMESYLCGPEAEEDEYIVKLYNPKEVEAHIKKSKYKKREWNIYSGVEEEDTSPCNRTKCIVLLSNGEFEEDSQHCGCWGYGDNVVAWTFKKKN